MDIRIDSLLFRRTRSLTWAAIALALAWGAASAGAQTSSALRSAEPVVLNFQGAEIEAVARTLATLSGRQVVVDPRVKGTITLISERPVTPAAAWNQFVAALRLQGHTVVESEGLYKVVPEGDAKVQTGVVGAGSVPSSVGGQVITQIFFLRHESANNLLPVLRPLITPANTINVNPGNNSLVITDYADNLRRLGRIIAAMDQPNATDVEVMALKHAIASELAPLVTRLVETSATATSAPGAAAADSGPRLAILAEPRSNALIVRAPNAARLALIRSLVEKLDQPAAGGDGKAPAAGNIHVVYLKNADATKLAATLRAAISGEARGASTPAASSGSAASTALTTATATTTAPGTRSSAATEATTGGQIQADAATNALIITAPEPLYRQLRAVIDQLDARRAQVFVESLIAEVNADKAAEFGIQWQGPIGKKGDGVVGLLGTNFSIGGANIIELAAQSASNPKAPSTGLNFGLAQRTNGIYVLGFLARFLQANGDGNILSTPNLLTLDNEEAKIVIGQNVPFVTGQYTNNNSGGNGAVNPFQTIERKDVGLTLRVKPQVSESGTVKLQIFQEVSSVAPSSINSPTGLITNKRSIESTVLVEDGGIVVLGGLLQDEYADNEEKVPGLGDVPLLGNLFKSQTRSRKKTNLMVFLRPVVLRDAQSTDSLSMDRYELMRGTQGAVQPMESAVVPVNAAPMLPPRGAQPRASAPAAAPAGSAPQPVSGER
jgi:general secretion pathway protein D